MDIYCEFLLSRCLGILLLDVYPFTAQIINYWQVWGILLFSVLLSSVYSHSHQFYYSIIFIASYVLYLLVIFSIVVEASITSVF